MARDPMVDDEQGPIRALAAEVEALRLDLARRDRVEAELREMARFPAENPNPVLRLDAEGRVLYANPAAAPLLQDWAGEGQDAAAQERPAPDPGRPCAPASWRRVVAEILAEAPPASPRAIEAPCGERLCSFVLAPGAGGGYVNVYGSDITERARAEKALRASEERYYRLFAGMTEGFALHEIVCDPEGRPCDYRFLEVNPAFEQLTGLKPADVLGRCVLEVIPDLEPFWIETFGRVALTGEPAQFEAYAGPLGRTYQCFAYRPAEGQFAVLFLDVTEQAAGRRRLEEAGAQLQVQAVELAARNDALRRVAADLDAERARLKAIFDYVPEGIVLVDAQGRILLANPAADELYARPVPYGDPFEDHAQMRLCHPDGTPWRSRDLPLTRSALDGEVLAGVEMAVCRGDGQRRDLLVNSAPVRDAGGRLLGAVGVFQDVTALKDAIRAAEAATANAERLLAGSERERRFFEQVMAATPVAIAVYSGPDHRYTYVSPHLCRISGRPAGWYLNHPFLERFPEEAGGAIVNALEEVARTGRPVSLPAFELPDRKGEPTYWDVIHLPLEGSEGEREGILAVAQDVTVPVLARRQAEAATREAEQRAAELDAAFEALPIGLAVYDAAGRITRLNEVALRTTRDAGVQAEAPLEARARAARATHPDGRPLRPDESAVYRALRGEVIRNQPLVVQGESDPIWLSVSAAPIRDPAAGGGRIRGAVGAYTDITELHEAQERLQAANEELRLRTEELEVQAEELQAQYRELAKLSDELEAQRARFEAVLEQMPSGVIIAEAPSGRMLLTNRQTEEIVGGVYRLAADPGEYLQYESFRPDGRPYRPEELPLARTMASGERVMNEEIHFVRGDGSRGVLLASSSPVMDRQGRITAGVLVFHDLTERKAIEEALREHAKERAALEERQRLARDLHDAVSQVLFSASLTADVLPVLYARDPAHGQQLLVDLRRMNRGALAEMRALLAELRPQALVEVDLATLLRHLAEAASGRAQIPVEVVVEHDCPLPAGVQVALYRIAQEALHNVAKHAEAGRATVRLCCPRGPDGQGTLSIEDDGCGFDPDALPANRFGLSIMAERAQAIGAGLAIDSCPGGGTRITVTWNTSHLPG